MVAVQTSAPAVPDEPAAAVEASGTRIPGLVAVGLPALLMLGIGLWRSGRPVLSWDEVATMDVARRSPAQLWNLVHHVDAVLGPYYGVMRWWTRAAGDTVLDLRLPSIIAMAGSVAVTAALGRRLFTPLTGLVAGLLLCLLPNTSRYAAEARPYAFACFFAALALLLLYRALERPGVPRWLGYGLAVAGAGASHLVALSILGAHLGVVALALHRDRSWRPALGWAAAVAGACALLTPMALLGLGQRPEQLDWVAPLTLATVRLAPADITGSAEAGWLLLGLAVAAAARPARHLAGPALAALVPLVVVAVVSVAGSPLWVARYLLIVLAPTALLAAAALTGTTRRPGSAAGRPSGTTGRPSGAAGRPGGAATGVRVALVLLLIGFAAWPGQLLVRGATAKNGSDYRGAAELIERFQRPGDGILYQQRSRTLRAATGYYLGADPGRPRDLMLLRTAAANGTLTDDEYLRAPADRLRGVPRVWLLVTGVRGDPETVRLDLRAELHGRYRRTGLWHLNRATLALYVRR